jgi:hypothetical protein
MERETKKIITIVGVVCASLLVILVLLYCVGLFVARSYVRRDMTDEEIAAMERYFDEPVEIPEAWREVEPFPRAVIEAGDRLRNDWSFLAEAENWERWGTQVDKLQTGRPMEDEDWTVVEQVVTEHEGVRKAIAELLSATGYELQAFPGSSPDADIPNFLLATLLAKEMALATHLEAERGHWDQAFEPSVVTFRMTRRHAASHLITHLIALACQRITSHCIARVAPVCDDPQALRYLLEEMNRLDPQINLDLLENGHLVQIVGQLRGFVREGQQVDFVSKKPLRYFDWQVIECYGRRLEEPVPPARKMLSLLPGASRIWEELIYKLYTPNVPEARVRELATKAEYDLARLTVAARIHQLETGKAFESVDDLASRYFAEPLTDPFSDDAYRWDSQEHCFYSVGPDKADHGAGMTYDASNGTVSTGDILLGST